MKIPLGKPYLKEESALEKIKEVLESRWISGGPRIKEFEDCVQEYNNDPKGHYIAVANGTVAIEMGLLAINNGKRLKLTDEVIVPSWSWVACGFAVNNAGGTPVWCDVNEYGVPFKLNSTHSHDLCLSRFWSRISTEGDYQSIHDHQSVFTFVIWLKIPFDGNKERNIQPGFRPEAGDFALVYPDTTGKIKKKNWILTPEMEGTMILFSSDINHTVYPHFSTKDYRVSVAGDVTISSLNPLDPIGTPLN